MENLTPFLDIICFIAYVIFGKHHLLGHYKVSVKINGPSNIDVYVS